MNVGVLLVYVLYVSHIASYSDCAQPSIYGWLRHCPQHQMVCAKPCGTNRELRLRPDKVNNGESLQTDQLVSGHHECIGDTYLVLRDQTAFFSVIG